MGRAESEEEEAERIGSGDDITAVPRRDPLDRGSAGVDDGPTIEIPVVSPPHGGRRALLRLALVAAVLAVVFGVVLPRLADIDYEAVGEALASLNGVEVAALLVGLGARMLADGAFQASILPGLGLRRGVVAHVSGAAAAATFPGPVDVVVRFSMYREWKYPLTQAGVSVTAGWLFNVGAKLVMPVFATLMLAAAGGAGTLLIRSAIAGAVILAALGGLLFGILRAEGFARSLGERVGSIAAWIMARLGRVGPDDLGEKIVVLRRDAVGLLETRWWRALLATMASQAASFSVLLMSLRFVGVSEADVTWLEAFAAFAIVQFAAVAPVTSGNVGVEEIAYLASLTAFSSSDLVAPITAAVIIYRAVTWLIVVPIGWGTYGVWRVVRAHADSDAGTAGAPA